MDDTEARILLKNVVQWHLKRPGIRSLRTLEEKAEEISHQCFAGGGTHTSNLITHYDDLDATILNVLRELEASA